MSQFDRKELVSLTEMSLENRQFVDGNSYMKEVIKMGTPLNYEERKMLFYSYRKLREPHLCSFCPLCHTDVDDKLKKELELKSTTAINTLCDEAIELLDNYWIKRDTNIEAVADYKKCRGIQYSNKAIVTSGLDRILLETRALKCFEDAYEIVNGKINPAHPVKLNIAVNLSSINIRLYCSVDKALTIANEAYKDGLSRLPELPEELKHHANKFIEVLKKKINAWSKLEN